MFINLVRFHVYASHLRITFTYHVYASRSDGVLRQPGLQFDALFEQQRLRANQPRRKNRRDGW
jgi:hypothetical protein